jgi:hypothetical protein
MLTRFPDVKEVKQGFWERSGKLLPLILTLPESNKSPSLATKLFCLAYCSGVSITTSSSI